MRSELRQEKCESEDEMIITENELRNGMTAIEVVKSLDLKQAHIIIKDVNHNEIDSYWYRSDCFHAERISDDCKVLAVSIMTEVSIISFTHDPPVLLTVNNKGAK